MSRFILVKHDAIKKGTHYDLRFKIPDDKNWRSFVFNSFPPLETGKKVYIPEAPIHSEKNALSLEPIPAGEYGAGKFTKIDGGDCEVLKYTNIHMIIDFKGSKLKGLYHFINTAKFGRKKSESNVWQFFKGKQTNKESLNMDEIDKLINQYLREEEEEVKTGQPNEENELTSGEEPEDLEAGKLKDDIIDELTEELLNSDEFGYLSESEKNWIKGAVKHPGALHRALHVKKGEKIPASKLKVKDSDTPKMKRMKTLAKTLKKMRKQ